MMAKHVYTLYTMCICTCAVHYMFRAIWEFVQSANCVVQTEDPQNAYQSADWHAICRLCITNCANLQVLLQ